MATTATSATGTNKGNWDEKELGCLWRKESKTTQEKFLTGVISLKNIGIDRTVDVVVFTNKRKTKDTHPDLRIYLSEKKGATPTPRATAPAPTPAPVVDTNELI